MDHVVCDVLIVTVYTMNLSLKPQELLPILQVIWFQHNRLKYIWYKFTSYLLKIWYIWPGGYWVLDVSHLGSFALSPFATYHWSIRYSVFFPPFLTLSTLVGLLLRCFSQLPANLTVNWSRTTEPHGPPPTQPIMTINYSLSTELHFFS